MIGTRIGTYDVIAKLGEGGMGEVYRAHDTKLGRDVAIKLLPSLFTSDFDRLSRFDREARVLASLNHPQIGAIYGFEDAGGVRALVLELVEGDTLAERISRGPVPLAEARSIAGQLIDALDAAHAKGIVHRDLKPANIKITRQGMVKVLDFGLAKAEPLDVSPETLVSAATTLATRDGLVLGTTAYMSPEQARGRPVDKRTDIWAFGCVLFEMLAGRGPFARETTPDTLAAILEREPYWSSLPADTPDSVRHLLRRCLDKDSTSRMREITDARADLDQAASREPTPAVGHRRIGAWIAVALATAIGVGAALKLIPTPGDASRSIAVLPFANASGNPDMDYLSDGITESLINTLSQVPDIAVTSRNSVFRYKGRDTDAQTVGQSLKVQSVVTGRVVQRGSDLSISVELIEVKNNRQIWGEQYNRKLLDILAVQEDISTEISEKLRLRLTGEDRQRLTRRYTQNTEAYQLYLRGRYHWNKKTAAGFLKGIEYFTQAIGIDPNYAPAYAALAALYNNLANYNFGMMPPKEAWSKAKAAAQRAVALDDSLASAHTSLALVAYQWEWDWSTADKEFKRALALDSGSASTYEPGPSSTNHWYAHYLMTMDRTEESFRANQRALQLDPLDLANNAHQGWHQIFVRQYKRAIEPLEKTIELNPAFPPSHWYLGMAFEQTESFAKAISQFETAARLTADNPSMLALLGHAYAAAGRKSDAQVMLARLTALSKEKYVPPYPIATIHAALGDRDQAIEWLERAYEERDSWMNYVHLDPRLDSLRSDPRFVSLVGRMNFTR